MTDTLPRSLAAEAAPDAAPPSTLTWAENRFLRNGVPTRILSGSVHYFRVHPDQWRDRLQRVKDLGLNTVDTYVPWNFHQPEADRAPDFTGWRDFESFLRIAAEIGLDATVRPGPYICAEWSNGGLPVWLTGRGIPLRSSDERFLGPVREWFSHLLPRIAALQANAGGPVVAVQVENEFGSFGDDRAYPAMLARELRAHGITELLFTADGPTELMLATGAVDGVLQGLTLGSRVDAARDLARTHRPDEPLLVAEYWNGWFDHWGHPHHVRGAANAAETLAGIVSDGGSVALYMAHGGTNFGLWAGANRVDGELRGTVTSYDSDAPIAEDGTLTEKFHAMRAVLGVTAPLVSTAPRFVSPQRVAVVSGASLGEALAILSTSARPVASTVSFEELGQDSGMVLLSADVLLPPGEIDLVFPRVADRAMVRVDGLPRGTVTESGAVTITGTGSPARVEIVIENLGRVNYGWSLGERKGLLAPVLVERRMVQGWQATSIDIAAAGETALALLAVPGTPDAAGGASAVFSLPEPADAHLALPGFVRGFVWVNGFLLGRYWEIGPQQTLYVPAPLLRAGENTVVVLELERRGTSIDLRDRAELGPEEEYIEQF
ncbi:MAG: beta-galactosidase [Microbacterium enclense]